MTDLRRIAATVSPRGRKLKHFIEALPGFTKAQAVKVRALAHANEAKRASRRSEWTDPLIHAANTRCRRTPTTIATRRATTEANAISAKVRRRIDQERAETEAATRRAMVAAANIARSMGYAVRSSRGRHGRISSYYCTLPGSYHAFRLSDHTIPATDQRDYMAQCNGQPSYAGYAGHELIIDQPRRREWLRRAIILIAAERDVPE